MIPPITVEVDAQSSERIEGLGGWGVDQAVVKLRSVNALRASVASSSATVEVDGVAQTVDFDGRGRGEVVLTTPGSHEVVLPDGSVVVGHVLTSAWDPLGIRHADLAPVADRVRLVNGRRVLVEGRRVWWVPSEGPAEVVLEVPEGEGEAHVVDADVDSDGVVDLVVWSNASIYFLRGAGPDEGYAWSSGLRSSIGELGGVAFEDIDDDGQLDLLAAWKLESDNLVDVSRGTGLLNFEPYQRLFLIGEPTDIAVAVGASESPELTVLTDNGEWERFIRGEDLLFRLVSSNAPATLPTGARLISAGDFHGDGVDDLLLVGIEGDGITEAQLFDLTTTPPTFIQRSPESAWVQAGDADGNGAQDLWSVFGNGEVKVLAADREQPVEWGTGMLPAGGPFAVDDMPGALANLWVQAGDHWQEVFGTAGSGGAIWRMDAPLYDNLLIDVERVWRVDDPASTAVVWVGTELRDNQIAVKRWSFTPGAPSVSELGRADLGPASQIDDAARCGDHIYVLASSNLVKVSVDGPPVELERLPTAATRVACTDDRVATLSGGQVLWYDLDLVQTSASATPGALDITLVPSSSGWDAQGCDTPDCSIEWWPGAPGGDASLIEDADGVRLTSRGGDVQELWGAGDAVLDDVDGDGRLDALVWRSDGVLAVHRATDTHIVDPLIWYVPRAVGRPAFVADADADGSPDLFAIDAEARLFATVSPPEQ